MDADFSGFFEDMENEVLNEDEVPFWKQEASSEEEENNEEAVPDSISGEQEGSSVASSNNNGQEISSSLYQSLDYARSFVPDYSKDHQADFGCPKIVMHSLDSYIEAVHDRFRENEAGWELCQKCTLEGDNKGTRVMPSIMCYDSTSLPSDPINLLVVGEA